MPAKTSKESSDREKACRFVLTAFFQRGQEISRLLVALCVSHRLESDPEPEFFGTIISIGRKLKHAIDRVVSADGRLFAANAALDKQRQVRGDKTFRLSRLIIGLRGACNSLFVDLPVQQLGFDARTAQDPVPLLMQADRVAESLEDGEVNAEYLFEGDDFDPKKYASQVRERAIEVRACLDQVAELKRAAEEVLLEKRAITEEYDELFLHGARSFESFCRLAGKTKLADRVRPSVSRPGRTEVPPDEKSESAGEESAASDASAQSSDDDAQVAGEEESATP